MNKEVKGKVELNGKEISEIMKDYPPHPHSDKVLEIINEKGGDGWEKELYRDVVETHHMFRIDLDNGDSCKIYPHNFKGKRLKYVDKGEILMGVRISHRRKNGDMVNGKEWKDDDDGYESMDEDLVYRMEYGNVPDNGIYEKVMECWNTLLSDRSGYCCEEVV